MIEQINSYEFDERFYQQVVNKKMEYRPSVTYKLHAAAPTEYGLIHWRGDVGNKRADEIMEEASALGSFVHDCIDKMINGEKISSDAFRTQFKPKHALKGLRCMQAFMDWEKEYKPKFLKNEYIVWNDEYNFAGTVDLRCQIGEETYLIDFKTSKSLSAAHKVQIAAYGMADPADKLALLQLGNTTKKRYTFSVLKPADVEKYTEQFKATSDLFEVMYPNAAPSQETFPEYFKL